MATLVTRSGKGSPLTHAEVDANFTNLNTDKLELSGGTMTGNLSFGDNDKAIFGAGSDLQIYSDGANSIIQETDGTGNLLIRASNINLQNSGATATLAQFIDGGKSSLRYNGSEKLATTSTGIDVTGTVTADGLTVNGDAKFTDISPAIILSESDTTDVNTRLGNYGGDFSITTVNDSDVYVANRLTVDHATGDISFYEDTGTTAKFFWDASAESLGIGTSSPDVKLHVSDGALRVAGTETAGSFLNIAASNTGSDGVNILASYYGSGSYGPIKLWTGGTERMRIDSSGNVGIGTSSPDNTLHLFGTSATPSLRFGSTSALYYWDIGRENATSGDFIFNQSINGSVSERMRIDSSGNVGIGNTNPSDYDVNADNLVVGTTSGNNGISIASGTTGLGSVFFADATSGVGLYRGLIQYNHSSDYMRFFTTSAEAMRIDSSGNLLVGTTDSTPYNNSAGTSADRGIVLSNSGWLAVARDGQPTAYFNRTQSDGGIIDFRKDGTTVGRIGSNSGTNLIIGTGDTGIYFNASNDAVHPWNISSNAARDNAIDLGRSSDRFDDIYATNAIIQTSDANEKQDIAELSDAEQRVAVAAKGLLRKFRWRDAVEEKGDEARAHFGIIAQDLQAAFAAEGLDAGDYAMFIHSTWTDEETGEERSRMGVRYSELLAFIIAAI